MSDNYESVLFVCQKIDVFGVPPPTGKGFKTDSWGGSLAKPIFTGRLRVIQTYHFDDSPSACEVRIEDGQTGELFAAAPYIGDYAVEKAQDSSRYYQIRVVHDKAVAYLGIGFEEREAAFDFQVVLSDFTKHRTAEKEAPRKRAEPVKDYSLKEGQVLNIGVKLTIQGKAGSHILAPPRSDSPATIPFLAPPPTAAEVRKSVNDGATDDDFGDFQ
ncbi:Putative uncharacterized protein [Taphrina deformans PYCC 5710]|uniref:NECAP PHear domain-containing protein n=1 Tax=Taphrina deformans (strain PYCC 5710 / ATCC 11124 / CBS 356.35 / IMI 108563 / JCM 9778 / NBRC 8474) TaxID=1097556 RepID=R5A3D0_TAPDE|nr:Putative uncharacterized protein [Taphrina deformans PYCC 5710]|eukprot:CCX35435.1 Putative uncharacterized protein [Taphrina deformans PYCC 5710]